MRDDFFKSRNGKPPLTEERAFALKKILNKVLADSFVDGRVGSVNRVSETEVSDDLMTSTMEAFDKAWTKLYNEYKSYCEIE